MAPNHVVHVPQQLHGGTQQQHKPGRGLHQHAAGLARLVGRELLQIEVRFGETRGHISGAPAGVPQPNHQLVLPALGVPAVVRQGGVHLHIRPQRVPAVQRRAGAVNAGLLGVFFFERTKEAVPHHPNATVIAVHIGVVHGMVHPVVGRRAKPAVKPAQAAHMLGVHPELIEQVDERDDAKHQRRHAGQRHRDVKNPAQQRTRGGLAQRRGKVVVVALVVHCVARPKPGHLVADAVKPVVAQVVEHQRQRVAVPGVPPGLLGEQGELLEHQGVDADAQQAGEDGTDLADHAQRNAADGVVQPIALGAGLALSRQAQAPQPFGQDQQEKHWRGQHDDKAHGGVLGGAAQILSHA